MPFKCCCGCTPCGGLEESEYTTVDLTSPTQTCYTPGDTSISLTKSNCCLVGTFDVGCQSPSYQCKLWAKGVWSISYDLTKYYAKASYNGSSCDCVPAQQIECDVTQTIRYFYYARYTLTGIGIKISKESIKCGESDPVCKWVVTVLYYYDVLDGIILSDVATPELAVNTICTGLYRSGDCSVTTTYSDIINPGSDTCTAAVDTEPAVSRSYSVVLQRFKTFDAKPTGSVSITNADTGPDGCTVESAKCAAATSFCLDWGQNFADNVSTCYQIVDYESLDYAVRTFSNCREVTDSTLLCQGNANATGQTIQPPDAPASTGYYTNLLDNCDCNAIVTQNDCSINCGNDPDVVTLCDIVPIGGGPTTQFPCPDLDLDALCLQTVDSLICDKTITNYDESICITVPTVTLTLNT